MKNLVLRVKYKNNSWDIDISDYLKFKWLGILYDNLIHLKAKAIEESSQLCYNYAIIYIFWLEYY